MYNKDMNEGDIPFRDFHNGCFVCGVNNPYGLKVDFRLENGELTGIFVPQEKHQGLPRVIHGGIISSLLDGAMAKLLFLKGTVALTVRLRTTFRRTVNPGEALKIKATLLGQRHKLFLVKATLFSPDGSVAAEATGTFLKRTEEKSI
jgi:acyl-coenzyme A thioesterase PaaI-like protein